MRKNKLFTYDSIALVPKYSNLESRKLANTSVNLCGYNFNLPVVPSNMIDVISFDRAKELSEKGFFYIMHRFEGATMKFVDYIEKNDLPLVSLSLGINGESKVDLEYAISTLGYERIHWLCVDVAHGHHKKVGEMLEYIRGLFPHHGCPKIIAGNVATADGYKYLADNGADVVKCGIGQGSICTTRYKTGFHAPTAYSVLDCVKNGDRDVPIIADGGAKHFGDVAKALVLGADMVMSGRWFAECIDSPARIVHGKKIYRGSTSYECKHNNDNIEGLTIELERGCTYMERIAEITQALQSSISYAGGTDLSAFNSVDWNFIK
ncbi:MAG TPA: IMP dehydrogenase [Bacteroidales bacterium]|mgnify:CR=1 FL=1|nr:IMP dehydrogenase [Bacteroidales bacterium]